MITCSMLDCEQPLLGSVVMIAPAHGEKVEWSKGFNTYVNMLDDGSSLEYLLLHQTCWAKLFDEFMRQDLMTNIEMLVGPIGLLAEEMGIPM